MKTEQLKWTKNNGWKNFSGTGLTATPQMVLIFGSTSVLKQTEILADLKKKYPDSYFIGCSTSGEIAGTEVNDDTVIATAVLFEHSKVISHSANIQNADDSYNAGNKLIKEFEPTGLRHVFVLSDGLNVNGSELVRGMRDALPEGVSVTGGLAGDGTAFSETLVINNNSSPQSKIISAIGLYGDKLQIGYGSFGGWDSFGIDRIVTKSKNNVLFELDGKPALELYKSFLGDQAQYLPSSGLLFPLSMRTEQDSKPVVRTILAVDEKDQSMSFAGDLPEGSSVRLMKANTDRLIDGAVTAADTSQEFLANSKPELAILISCVGRKLVLKQLVEEEVEGVSDRLGGNTAITGFYSYGEISPFSKDAKCELHNQTMTITTLTEA